MNNADAHAALCLTARTPTLIKRQQHVVFFKKLLAYLLLQACRYAAQ
jgi:hypothetical protein